MAALVSLVFATNSLRYDKNIELRVVTVLGALLGAISLMTRPRGLADEFVVGAYLFARLHHFYDHEAARVSQILLLLLTLIIAIGSHNLLLIEVIVLIAHVGFTAIELSLRLELDDEKDTTP